MYLLVNGPDTPVCIAICPTLKLAKQTQSEYKERGIHGQIVQLQDDPVRDYLNEQSRREWAASH